MSKRAGDTELADGARAFAAKVPTVRAREFTKVPKFVAPSPSDVPAHIERLHIELKGRSQEVRRARRGLGVMAP